MKVLTIFTALWGTIGSALVMGSIVVGASTATMIIAAPEAEAGAVCFNHTITGTRICTSENGRGGRFYSYLDNRIVYDTMGGNSIRFCIRLANNTWRCWIL